MLQARATQIGVTLNIQPFIESQKLPHSGNGSLTVLHRAINNPAIAGTLDAQNSEYVLETLRTAA
jgi:4-hydroxythreonine-4-phosphate dehydrogenase